MSAEACWESRGRPLFAVEEVFVSALFRQRGGDGFNGFRPLPAPGYRACGAGTQSSVGNEGNSWSSTVGDINGIYLRFITDSVQPSYSLNRAYGFQLRCLSE